MSHDKTFKNEIMNDPLSFFSVGMDRGIPQWFPPVGGLPVLHLGPGVKHVEGTIELEWPEYDFENCTLPFEDESVGGAMTTHVLEHLSDPRHILAEVSRVLVPGAPFNILVPHGQSLLFLQDLDHKTPFVIQTWKTALDNSYYLKGKGGINFRLGLNMTMAIKEENTALVTQLIKL